MSALSCCILWLVAASVCLLSLPCVTSSPPSFPSAASSTAVAASAGPPAAPINPAVSCRVGPADLSSLRSLTLQFVDPDTDKTFYLQPCSALPLAQCRNNETGAEAALCRFDPDSLSWTAEVEYAAFYPASLVYLAPYNITYSLQDESVQPPRSLSVLYSCVPSARPAVIVAVSGANGSWTVMVDTAAACPVSSSSSGGRPTAVSSSSSVAPAAVSCRTALLDLSPLKPLDLTYQLQSASNDSQLLLVFRPCGGVPYCLNPVTGLPAALCQVDTLQGSYTSLIDYSARNEAGLIQQDRDDALYTYFAQSARSNQTLIIQYSCNQSAAIAQVTQATLSGHGSFLQASISVGTEYACGSAPPLPSSSSALPPPPPSNGSSSSSALPPPPPPPPVPASVSCRLSSGGLFYDLSGLKSEGDFSVPLLQLSANGSALVNSSTTLFWHACGPLSNPSQPCGPETALCALNASDYTFTQLLPYNTSTAELQALPGGEGVLYALTAYVPTGRVAYEVFYLCYPTIAFAALNATSSQTEQGTLFVIEVASSAACPTAGPPAPGNGSSSSSALPPPPPSNGSSSSSALPPPPPPPPVPASVSCRLSSGGLFYDLSGLKSEGDFSVPLLQLSANGSALVNSSTTLFWHACGPLSNPSQPCGPETALCALNASDYTFTQLLPYNTSTAELQALPGGEGVLYALTAYVPTGRVAYEVFYLCYPTIAFAALNATSSQTEQGTLFVIEVASSAACPTAGPPAPGNGSSSSSALPPPPPGNGSSSSSVLPPPPPSSSSTGTGNFSFFCRLPDGSVDLSALSQSDLSYTDSAGSEFLFRPCGVVGSSSQCVDAVLCESNPMLNSSLTLVAFNPTSSNAFTLQGNASGGGVLYDYPDGTSCCRNGQCYDRSFELLFVCDAAASSPAVTDLTFSMGCEWTATVSTALACPASPPTPPSACLSADGAFDLLPLSSGADLTLTLEDGNTFLFRPCNSTQLDCRNAQGVPSQLCLTAGEAADVRRSPLFPLVSYFPQLQPAITASNLSLGLQYDYSYPAQCNETGRIELSVLFNCSQQSTGSLTSVRYSAAQPCTYELTVDTSLACAGQVQPPRAQAQPASSAPASSVSTAAVIAIAVVGALACAVLPVLLYLLCRQSKPKDSRLNQQLHSDSDFVHFAMDDSDSSQQQHDTIASQ